MNMNQPQTSRKTQFLAGFNSYFAKIRLFRRNAWLYLIFTILNGLTFGIYWLLFNFYILSLGFDEALLGQILTITSLVALFSALPAGVVSDRIGRKPTMLLSSMATVTAVFGMVFWPTIPGFYTMSVLMGISQSLAGVTFGPFLMENSGEEERTYLFSFSFGMQMIASFAGNWFGGMLPTWVGIRLAVDATSSLAYGRSMFIVACMGIAAIFPVLLIRRQRAAREEEDRLSPFQYARQHPAMLGKFIFPILITSLGAGLLIPFMNIFFRTTYNSSDSTIGTLFAASSLAMAVGLLLAPPLADKMGKMRMVILTQALSIPFLFMLGFAPWFWLSATAYLVRQALMNMSNPVYEAFVMENVDEEARATVASLTSMSWNFGWAFSPTISGKLQVAYGFGPVFAGTITLYVIAIFLYYRFFWHSAGPARA
ncbi:MAG: MFS transporter [Chloroflexi bacterium]|nr:MAG: MFS transporter [Chloroflexota bacterium]